jgi:thiamine-phosphate pyrophosphorylase
VRGLYAIVDTVSLAARGVDPLAFAAAVLAARPALLQLRAKDRTREDTLALLRALAPMCRAAGVPLVANDAPDLAAAAGCDAVHVGQSDPPIAAARAVAPGLGVGVSTHDPAELTRALAERPLYVAYGPIFATTSKENPDPVVGLDGLRAAAALAKRAGVPLVAIGGIDVARAPLVSAAAADMVAVIGALLPEVRGSGDLGDVTSRARAFARALASPQPAPQAAP